MKTSASVLLAASLLAVTLSGCAAGKTRTVPELIEPVALETDRALVRRGELYTGYAYSFAVEAETLSLSFDVDGIVGEIPVKIGDTVQAGDPLLLLQDKSLREQLETLNEQRSAQKEQNRLQRRALELDMAIQMAEMKKNSTLEEESQQAEQKRLALRLEQETERQELEERQLAQSIHALEEKLETCVLSAPQAGRVIYLGVAETDGVQAGQTVCVLALEEKPILLGEEIPAAILNNADEMIAQIGGETISVDFIEPEAQERMTAMLQKQALYSRFRILSELPSAVKTGDDALLVVRTDLKTDALSVPPNALYRDVQGYFVYRLHEDGGKERTAVRVGHRYPDAIEILEGLKEGEEVYVP